MPKQRHEGNFWGISHALFLDLGTVTQECSLYKSVSFCTPISLHIFLYAVMLQLFKKAVQWLFFWIFLISMYWIYIGLETPIGLALLSVPPYLLLLFCSFTGLILFFSQASPSPPQGLCTGCCFCLKCSDFHIYTSYPFPPSHLCSNVISVRLSMTTATCRSDQHSCPPQPASFLCLPVGITKLTMHSVLVVVVSPSRR